MSIKVDQDLCIGCGACAAICPDVFKMGESGKAEVTSQDNVECAKNAASGCPVQAISVD
jgi:ferredoxin